MDDVAEGSVVLGGGSLTVGIGAAIGKKADGHSVIACPSGRLLVSLGLVSPSYQEAWNTHMLRCPCQ